MSCSCQKKPCSCATTSGSKCTYKKLYPNNSWVERGSPEAEGICLLDTYCDEDIIGILQRVPGTREDLRQITNDPHLLHLADTVPFLSGVSDEVAVENQMNNNKLLPQYHLFRGKPPE